MTKIIRQKLGSSKKRLIDKIKDIQEVFDASESDLTKYDAGKYLMELEKKVETFRRHVDELEKAAENDEAEQDRFLNDYEALEEILNNAEEMHTKLDYIVKYRSDQKKELLQKVDKEKEAETMMFIEKIKRETECENERLKILSNEKIELEKINLEKMKIHGASGEDTAGSHEENRLRKLVPSIKLPKFELLKFDGNILKWQEFWDSYEAMIHRNPSLQTVDKFNYLKIHILGETKEVISGIDITSNNYDVAIQLLTERYGKKHLMVAAHYSQLRDIPQSTGHYSKLRITLDCVEKHLRSLESLGEDVNNNMIVSMVKSKLPKYVIARLEEYKDDDDTPWNLETIRKGWKKFVTAQEAGERQMNLNNQISGDEKEKPPK